MGILINSAEETFLHVGSLVSISIILFGYINYKTSGNFVNIISKNIISQMRERTKQNPEDVYWIDDDIYNFEHIKKDQGFYINSNNELVICFDKYEVAPGSSGLVEFKIPKSVTNQLMNN